MSREVKLALYAIVAIGVIVYSTIISIYDTTDTTDTTDDTYMFYSMLAIFNTQALCIALTTKNKWMPLTVILPFDGLILFIISGKISDTKLLGLVGGIISQLLITMLISLDNNPV